MIKKKIEKLPKDYFICKGCNRQTHIYWETTLGKRCIKCVINYNLTFLWETESGIKKWGKAKWLINGNDLSKIRDEERQNLNIPSPVII